MWHAQSMVTLVVCWKLAASDVTVTPQIVDIWHNVIFTDSTVHTICDNADRITGSAKSGTEVFV
jgi:hypothetical protein